MCTGVGGVAEGPGAVDDGGCDGEHDHTSSNLMRQATLAEEDSCSLGDDEEAEKGHEGEIARLGVVLVSHEQDVARHGEDGGAKDGIHKQGRAHSERLAINAAKMTTQASGVRM